MRKRGRPTGTGYDDSNAIGRVLDLMRLHGMSRRSAIIRIAGIDQLRRIEMKMRTSSLVPNGIWTNQMIDNDRMVPMSFLLQGEQFNALIQSIADLSDEECDRIGILRMSMHRHGIQVEPAQINTFNPFGDPTSSCLEIMKLFDAIP